MAKGLGGQFQLWNKDVKKCEAAFDPIFNRCVIFETNEISFHGVIPVSPAAPSPRRSFATYYYTKDAPAHWTGVSHSTIFKARPEEKMKGLVLMPVETIKNGLSSGVRTAKRGIKKVGLVAGRHNWRSGQPTLAANSRSRGRPRCDL